MTSAKLKKLVCTQTLQQKVVRCVADLITNFERYSEIKT